MFITHKRLLTEEERNECEGKCKTCVFTHPNFFKTFKDGHQNAGRVVTPCDRAQRDVWVDDQDNCRQYQERRQ